MLKRLNFSTQTRIFLMFFITNCLMTDKNTIGNSSEVQEGRVEPFFCVKKEAMLYTVTRLTIFIKLTFLYAILCYNNVT